MTSVLLAITGLTGKLASWPLSPARPQPTSGLRFHGRELSGGLGDIGVMVPIVAVLITQNGFNATSVLLVFGLTHVITGLYFRIPVPVQPLKAMAAIAIAQGLGADAVSAAAIVMGLLLLTLAVTGLMRPLTALFSLPVIRGIQLAVGLLLVRSALKLSLSESITRDGGDVALHLGSTAVPVAVVIAAALLPVMMLAVTRRAVPAMLALLPPSIAVGALMSFPGVSWSDLGPQMPTAGLPAPNLMLSALTLLVIPQLPLTLGNAVIASADTARGYYGDRAARVTHRSLLTSQGLANLFAGVVGGMPVCHGSGGVTAHYTFGARTGLSTAVFGVILLVLGLGFSGGVSIIFGLIPLPVLGALLFLVGAQHALLARDVRGHGWLVAGVIGVVALLTSNVGYGFAAGIALDLTFRRYRSGASSPDVAAVRPANAEAEAA